MATTATFYIDDLNLSNTLVMAPSFTDGSAPDAITGGTDIGVSGITVAMLKDIFKFTTDSTDLVDSTDDITGALAPLKWNDTAFNLAAGGVSATQAQGGVATTVEYDYVRHFSKEVLGSARADLFGNESTMRLEVQAACNGNDSAVNASIKTALGLQTTADSIMSDMVKTLVNTPATLTRITDLVNTGTVLAEGVSTFDFPFIANDKLVFKLTLAHAAVTVASTHITDQAVADKSYLVTITVAE
jgi:hypothetical protein